MSRACVTPLAGRAALQRSCVVKIVMSGRIKTTVDRSDVVMRWEIRCLVHYGYRFGITNDQLRFIASRKIDRPQCLCICARGAQHDLLHAPIVLHFVEPVYHRALLVRRVILRVTQSAERCDGDAFEPPKL